MSSQTLTTPNLPPGLVTPTMVAESLESLDLEDYLQAAALWDLYNQQQDFIKKAGYASYLMPGVGQIMAKDGVGATLMIAGNLALSAGIILGTNLLLPRSVRIGTLDYFGSSFADIEAAWKDLTFISLLPSMGVITAGSIIMHLFRDLSADDARLKAQQALSTGKVVLTPDFGVDQAGRFIFGIRSQR
ncbi:MAG: hypothetical protein GW949_10780 [Spirochaetales bacterium]|nr:hypothetical protein [Spirochaetales bacterium]